MIYTPLNWYWVVDGSTTQVWSSASRGYVALSDSTYTAWLANSGNPTKIDTLANLLGVVAPYLLANGVQITSTSTSALDGTYSCDASSQSKIAAISLYILVNSSFPGGGSTYPWIDLSGTAHTFPSTDSFQAFATAIADYVAALDFVIAGAGDTLPSNAVTIA